MIGVLLLVLLGLQTMVTNGDPVEAKTKIYLRLNEPRDLLVEPYKLYEIYVPLSQLTA